MLQWLVDQVVSILRVINTIFGVITTAANNLFQQIMNWAVWARDIAINFAIGIRDYLITEIVRYASYLWTWIFRVRDDLMAWVLLKISHIVINVNNLVSLMWSMIEPFITPIRDWLWSQIVALQNFVLVLQNNLLGMISWWIQKLGSLEALVTTTRVPSIDEVVKIVLRDLQPILSKLVEFTSDPVGYIITIVSDNFIAMLTGALAWGLGTTKYELPPAPANYAKKRK